MHNRLHRPNNGDGERVRGRTKTGQSKDARDDKERWSIPEEECPMVSRPRQLQRYGWKGSRKLLLIPSIPARHQPHRSEEHTSELQSPDQIFPYTTLFRSHRPNNGDGERVRGRTKTGQSKDARDDKERWSIPEEECPMVSRPRQLQRYGWKGSRKLLLIPSIPARHQPHQIPDRNDECSSGYSRLGKITLVHGQGLRKSSSNPYEPYREGKETLPFEDPP